MCVAYSDVDECLEYNNTCHENADCFNNIGSYCCACQHGYYGDGLNCTGTIHHYIANLVGGLA